jgi:hypothetical protein
MNVLTLYVYVECEVALRSARTDRSDRRNRVRKMVGMWVESGASAPVIFGNGLVQFVRSPNTNQSIFNSIDVNNVSDGRCCARMVSIYKTSFVPGYVWYYNSGNVH